MGDLSAHFSRREFATCRRGECPSTVVELNLVAMLERLRSLAGDRPLRIVSGYRCEACNKRSGGAKKSQHLYGRAADIPSGYATLAQARAAGARGVGTKGRWAIHVDVRPGPLATWTY